MVVLLSQNIINTFTGSRITCVITLSTQSKFYDRQSKFSILLNTFPFLLLSLNTIEKEGTWYGFDYSTIQSYSIVPTTRYRTMPPSPGVRTVEIVTTTPQYCNLLQYPLLVTVPPPPISFNPMGREGSGGTFLVPP